MRCIGTTILLLTLGTVVALAQTAASRPVEGWSEVLFQDQFPNEQIHRRKWVQATGVRISDPELPPAVTFHGGGLDRATLKTRTFPMNVGSAVLTIQLVVDPGTTGAFRVDYLDERDRWVRLLTLQPQETVGFHDPLVYQQALPVGALHQAGALRFRAVGLERGGRWHLLRVQVEGFAEQNVMTADIAGPDWGWLGVYDADQDVQRDVAVPYAEAFPIGQSLALLAPAEIDQWHFNYWTVAGEITHERLLPVTMDASNEAVAHYWPATESLAMVRVVLSDRRARVAMRLAGGPLLQPDATGVYHLRVGDSVDLDPTPADVGLVFVGWSDGGPARRTLVVSGDVVLQARYAVRGDLNGDGLLDKLDVDALILALASPEGFHERFPDVPADLVGDLDGDGRLTEADVDPFVGLFFDED